MVDLTIVIMFIEKIATAPKTEKYQARLYVPVAT
jgi:hypothetical protein